MPTDSPTPTPAAAMQSGMIWPAGSFDTGGAADNGDTPEKLRSETKLYSTLERSKLKTQRMSAQNLDNLLS